MWHLLTGIVSKILCAPLTSPYVLHDPFTSSSFVVVALVIFGAGYKLRCCELTQITVTHCTRTMSSAAVAVVNVQTAMELEAYREKPAKDRSLYTSHFIVVLQSTSRLSPAKIAIFSPYNFRILHFGKR